MAFERDNFEKLLRWLDNDREIAGQKYEEIRIRLIKIFLVRGVNTAEELADETLQRVTDKVSKIAGDYQGDPISYFYGVARLVFLEYTRKPKLMELTGSILSPEKSGQTLEAKDRCLTRCLEALLPKQHEFLKNYYKEQKQEKIATRKRMAEDLGISHKVLRVRAFRIREGLKKCIQKCLDKKSDETF